MIPLFYSMILPDYTSVCWLALLTALFFIIITLRYFLVAGLFYLIFYAWFPAKFEIRKISKKKYEKGQLRKEMKWSIITSLLFSVTGALTVILWQRGYTRVYTKTDQYGWWYLPVSLILFLFLHETYYYWLHRWMHRPGVFRWVHKIHHDSHIASPFTAFSFHPLEGLLQAVFLPALLLILPVHYGVILILLTLMTFSSVINHLGIELYPRQSATFLGRWVIGATHHSLHHKWYRYNFGLYFTFWDRLKKTESPGFQQFFKKSASRTPKKGIGNKKVKNI
jgi:sterol desaturase/sphingolipid hydroxylase (fatty acid hydroxylase superfamily)